MLSTLFISIMNSHEASPIFFLLLIFLFFFLLSTAVRSTCSTRIVNANKGSLLSVCFACIIDYRTSFAAFISLRQQNKTKTLSFLYFKNFSWQSQFLRLLTSLYVERRWNSFPHPIPPVIQQNHPPTQSRVSISWTQYLSLSSHQNLGKVFFPFFTYLRHSRFLLDNR